MTIRTAGAEWRGNLAHGFGHVRFGSGAFGAPYDFRSRMAEGTGTNPEECSAQPTLMLLDGAGPSPDECGRHRQMHSSIAKVHFEERDVDSLFIGSISTQEPRSPIWRRQPSRNMRRTPRTTARSREPCLCRYLTASQFPVSFGVLIACAYISFGTQTLW